MAPDVRRPIDRWLLAFSLLLVVIGMVWVYSATGTRYGASMALKQGISALIGIALMLALSQVDLLTFRENPKLMIALYVGFLVSLGAVFLFEDRNGAHRWILLAGQQIQPSEFFKPFSVLMVAWWMVRHRQAWTNQQEAIPKLVTLMLLLALPLGLIYLEPDLGTTFLILFVAMLVVFLGGAPKYIFVITIPVLLALGTYFIVSTPYRYERVKSFLNPELDSRGGAYQTGQSLTAVGNGGLVGVGLGAGQQKLHFLPEAHTDFIYAIIGEEAGLAGTSTVLLLFVGILWRGYRIARRVRDAYLRLCASGFTLLLVAQGLMNMSVVLSLVPNKGIPLPFISYGGSSLMASLLCLGLLLSISKEASE